MQNNKINILLFGAVDRFNYGDLLFPVIIKQKLLEYNSTDLNISVCGIIQSNFTEYGALPSESLQDFYQKCEAKNTYVIVVGGEVLSARWGNIYSYLNSCFNQLYYCIGILFRKYSIKINNTIAKILLKGRTEFPFIIETDKFPNLEGIIYNAVGGVPNNRNISKRIIQNLSKSTYISCRENISFNNLERYIPNVKLMPDSAILMSTLFKKEDLISLKKLKDTPQDYVFFQISISELKRYSLSFIVEKLNKIYFKHKKNIVLCPIGTALGHSDHNSLGTISSYLQFEHTLIEEPTIWDIMHLIANSSLYVGSSLHGVITAMSFSIPYLAIRNTSKIIFYLDTWAIPELNEVTNKNNWDKNLENAFSISKTKLFENRNYQITLAEQSMQKICNLIA